MTSTMGHSSICTNIQGNFMIYDLSGGTLADKQEKQQFGKFGGQSALTVLKLLVKRKYMFHYGIIWSGHLAGPGTGMVHVASQDAHSLQEIAVL